MSNKGTALNIKYQILLKIIKPLFKHLLISGKTIFFFFFFGQGKNSTGLRKQKNPQTYHLEGYRKNYRCWVSSILCINSYIQSIKKEISWRYKHRLHLRYSGLNIFHYYRKIMFQIIYIFYFA